MDYKFWSTLAVNMAGLGFMYWQVRIMRKQIGALPPARFTKRFTLLSKRLYMPVFVMVGLVLVSWLPYILVTSKASNVIPQFLVAWGGTDKGCTVVVDTSGIVRTKDKYRLFLACQISDPTVDQLEDERIAVSKPFKITGGLVQISILYEPSSGIATIAKPRSVTNIIVVLLPKDQDGSRIRRLSDVNKEGGQIIIPGGKLKD